jgi:hypothetical protein
MIRTWGLQNMKQANYHYTALPHPTHTHTHTHTHIYIYIYIYGTMPHPKNEEW